MMQRLGLSTLAFVLLAFGLGAQDLRLVGPNSKRVKLGAGATYKLVYVGKDEATLLEPTEQDRLQFVISVPSSILQTSIVNGRVTREQSTSWTITVLPEREGRYLLLPFRVKVGNTVLKSRASSFVCKRDKRAERGSFIEAGIVKNRVYIYQPVDIWIKVAVLENYLNRILGSHRERINLNVRAAWLDDFPAGVSLDSESRGQQVFVGVNRRYVLATRLPSVTRGTDKYFVVEIRRRFLPNKAGRFRLAAPDLAFTYATGYRQTFFGREISSTAHGYSVAKAIDLEVLPLPQAGRPKNFKNAVGTFTLRGQLSKRNLELNEPVRFTLEIAGDGNLEFLDPPELESLDGFHRFKMVVERTERRLVVQYELSAIDPDTTEFPELTFSYFDPAAEPPAYRAAKIAAIPVTVKKPKNMVSLPDLPDTSKGIEAGIDDIWDQLTLSGLPPSRFVLRPWMSGLVIISPLFLLGFWFAVIKRRAHLLANPQIKRRRNAKARFMAQNEQEGALRSFSFYLAERFAWRDGAAVRDDLVSELEDAGVEAELANACHGLMNRLLGSRYGAQSDESALLAEVKALVFRVEAEVK